jgi:hypothetical protein
MNKLILFILIVTSFSSKPFAQLIELKNVIGKKYIIKSEDLDEM